MHVLAGVGVHETRLAPHVAAVGQIENDERPSPVLNTHRSVIVHGLMGPIFLLWDYGEVLHPFVKGRIRREQIPKFSVSGAAFLYEDLSAGFDDLRIHDAGVIAKDLRRVAMGHRRYHL
jgi:hypothetical protein